MCDLLVLVARALFGGTRRRCDRRDGRQGGQLERRVAAVAAVALVRERGYRRGRGWAGDVMADGRQRRLLVECGRRLEGGQVERLQDGRPAERIGGLGPRENRCSQRGGSRDASSRNARRLSRNVGSDRPSCGWRWRSVRIRDHRADQSGRGH